MNTRSGDFVTVQMPSMKDALTERAHAQRVSVSALVRQAIARELALVDCSSESAVAMDVRVSEAPMVKMSIRLTRGEAEQLRAGARRAGLSRGAFLMGLLADVPSLSAGAGSRLDCLVALTASNSELSTLARSINQLTALLRRGEVQAAKEYRQMLDTLAHDIRAHLRLAACVLAEVGPACSLRARIQS
jgi:hypothetical protein